MIIVIADKLVWFSVKVPLFKPTLRLIIVLEISSLNSLTVLCKVTNSHDVHESSLIAINTELVFNTELKTRNLNQPRATWQDQASLVLHCTYCCVSLIKVRLFCIDYKHQ